MYIDERSEYQFYNVVLSLLIMNIYRDEISLTLPENIDILTIEAIELVLTVALLWLDHSFRFFNSPVAKLVRSYSIR